ncbi:MAG TPA: hypothetical protein VHY33_06105 [Thermoanaerobaculia bacterium]|nr:hypothetical protein [Thermoanaerobaculia bacterium]
MDDAHDSLTVGETVADEREKRSVLLLFVVEEGADVAFCRDDASNETDLPAGYLHVLSPWIEPGPQRVV